MKRTRKTPTGQETSITNGQLYFEDAKQCAVDSELFTEIISDGYTNSIRITSLSSNWSEKNYIGYDATLVTSINVQMTMRREVRMAGVTGMPIGDLAANCSSVLWGRTPTLQKKRYWKLPVKCRAFRLTTENRSGYYE